MHIALLFSVVSGVLEEDTGCLPDGAGRTVQVYEIGQKFFGSGSLKMNKYVISGKNIKISETSNFYQKIRGGYSKVDSEDLKFPPEFSVQ